jgi:hypothetical protein
MASSSPSADSTPQLPDYVPVPEGAFGPALNDQHLGQLGTREDLVLHQQYIGEIVDSSYAATSTTVTILHSIRLDLGTASQVHQ